jgi:valyl-tRNA synthetase
VKNDLSRVAGKLNNSSFVDKAPAEVVARERQKLDSLQQALAKLQQQQLEIQQL